MYVIGIYNNKVTLLEQQPSNDSFTRPPIKWGTEEERGKKKELQT